MHAGEHVLPSAPVRPDPYESARREAAAPSRAAASLASVATAVTEFLSGSTEAGQRLETTRRMNTETTECTEKRKTVTEGLREDTEGLRGKRVDPGTFLADLATPTPRGS